MRLPVLVLALTLTQRSAAQTAPVIDAQALDGTSVHLPDQHLPTVLILGFSRKAGDGVMAWSKVLSHTAWNTKAATVYEVGFLGSVPKPIRGFITRSMRKQVPPAAQNHFLIVTTDTQPWKSLAGTGNEDEPYIVLLDASGHLRWRTHGPYTGALATEVARQVEAIPHHP